jgi:sortase A
MSRRIFGIILILIGLLTIGYVAYSRHSANKEQQELISGFEKILQEMGKEEDPRDNQDNQSEQINNQNQQVNNDNQQANAQEVPTAQPAISNNAIAILEIPKIDLTVAVVKGTEPKDLKHAVGHFENTAMPGEKGNFCVAGHRSYTYNEYFNRLDELDNGDKIKVRTEKGTFIYEIYEKKVVEPTEVSVLNQTEDSTITLVTCTPIRVATHRLIIKGKLK